MHAAVMRSNQKSMQEQISIPIRIDSSNVDNLSQGPNENTARK